MKSVGRDSTQKPKKVSLINSSCFCCLKGWKNSQNSKAAKSWSKDSRRAIIFLSITEQLRLIWLDNFGNWHEKNFCADSKTICRLPPWFESQNFCDNLTGLTHAQDLNERQPSDVFLQNNFRTQQHLFQSVGRPFTFHQLFHRKNHFLCYVNTSFTSQHRSCH